MATRTAGKSTVRIARATCVAALLVLLAGPLIAKGILGWQAGLGMFVIAALLAGIGGVICLVALFRRRRSPGIVVAAAAGIAAIAIPAAIVIEGRAFPPINDITTDTTNPPAFEAITATMRGPGTAPLAYDPAFAAIQTKAYPDLAPLHLSGTPADVADRVLKTIDRMGWSIAGVKMGPNGGRYEATATVPWWGFKDDVVVRLTPEGDGFRVDVRSKSRVGKGDLGVNAKRIADYLAKLQPK
jgi:uncharacterized protein (DUF1499 family)